MHDRGFRHPSVTLAWIAIIVMMSTLLSPVMPSNAQAWDHVVIVAADARGPSIHMVTYEVVSDSQIEMFWNASGPLDFTIQGPDGEFFEETSTTSVDIIVFEVSSWGQMELMWSNFDQENDVILDYWIEDWAVVVNDIEHPEESTPFNVLLVIAVIVITIIGVSLLFWYLSRGPRPGVIPAYPGIEYGTPGAVPSGLPSANVGGVPVDTATRPCWKCGSSVGPGTSFCPDCGVAQKDHNSPPPTQPPNL